MDYSIFDTGLLLHRVRLQSRKGIVGGGVKRGKVEGFSLHARLRLRKFLLFRHIPGADMWGVTLTIPAQEDCSSVVELFRCAVHRLRVYFLRRFPRSGFVWRVELQRNRMPHLHLVVYTRLQDVPSLFLRLWSDIVLPLFSVPSLSDFLRHGVLCKMLDGDIRAYRYICDHGSKMKQAQLGWKGRQWGVVGREFFTEREHVRVNVDGKNDVMFSRFLRRLVSFSVKADCVFGSKLVRRRGLNTVVYVSSSTITRWLEHYDMPF